jgi:hypothetical protein
MRSLLFAAAAAAVIFTSNAFAQTPMELADIWDSQHVTRRFPSNLRHADIKAEIAKLKTLGLNVKEVGRSNANREIYQVEFGTGPLKILMWSQMHGDEPTATSSLIDLFTILRNNRDKEWVQHIEKAVTLRAIPMLNPDGAETFIRRNRQGIDINRDAIDLKTPEARLLKRLREEFSPEIGFNLHNQNSLTSVEGTFKQAAISLLVVYGDEAKTTNAGHERNRRIASMMRDAIEKFIPMHVAEYDDEYTATAFGDNFSAWGTPTILIETGALKGHDEMYLVKMNFIALATALKAVSDGSEKTYSTMPYDTLPPNGYGRLMDFVFRNGSVIKRTEPGSTLITDIGINKARRREMFAAPTFIRKLGRLSDFAGLEEYDASGFYVIGRFQPITEGSFGDLLFYKKKPLDRYERSGY